MKTTLNNVLLPTLFNVVNNIVQHCYTWTQANSDSMTLNNIVDNIEQCGQQNIVQCCFQQPWTGCSFLLCIVIARTLTNILLVKCVKRTSSGVPTLKAKSRDYKERQVDRKKRKAIRRWFVSIRHGRHVLSQCPKQRQSPPGNIKKWLLIPGEIPLFRALANNMAPMTNHWRMLTNYRRIALRFFDWTFLSL